MLVRVKLYSYLQKYGPVGSDGQFFEVELPDRSTVADLVAVLQIRSYELSLAYVNDEARSELFRLKPGDVVGLFPPMGGG